MNKHAYWLTAAVLGLAGCAGNSEQAQVPKNKPDARCFLNCEVPENLGKQYLDGPLPDDLVRVERVNSRQRADYSKFGPQMPAGAGALRQDDSSLRRALPSINLPLGGQWRRSRSDHPLLRHQSGPAGRLWIGWATCCSPVTTRRCWRCVTARMLSWLSTPSMPCPNAAGAARAGPRSIRGRWPTAWLELGYSKPSSTTS